ncbi:gamma-aminobutyric acid type B receptor subunit 1-like [Glandiceps talaboti]
MKLVLFVALLLTCRSCRSDNDKIPLYLAGLFPIETRSWNGGEGGLPAAELGLLHVNAREDLLPGYELKMIWKDSKCNSGDAVDAMYKMLYEEPQKIMIYGPGCSAACQGTAASSHHWSVVQVNTDLVTKMEGANITVLTTETFLDNAVLQMERIKKKGARIIIGNFYRQGGIKVFCEGALSVDTFKRHPDPTKRGIANLTTDEYFEIYDKYVNYTGESRTGYSSSTRAYDGIWAIALALNNTHNTLEKMDNNKRLENFTYGDDDMAQLILQNFNDLTFDGTSGRIQFNKYGDVFADYKVQQYQDTVKVRVGIYKLDNGIIEIDPESPIIWKGGSPPVDATRTYYIIAKVAPYLYYMMSVFAILGISCGLGFLVFMNRYRHKRIIKMSSPNINNIILCGCILTYISILPANVKGFNVNPLHCCKASIYLLLLGFSLAYGALFSKTWRVHVIFTNKKVQRKAIKDSQLLIGVVVIVTIDIITVGLWEVLDPLMIVIRDANEIPLEIGDKVFISQVAYCESPKMTYWVAIIYSMKAIVLLFGGFLAWETRKVSIAVLNDSRYIGMCIYNVVILSCLGAPLTYILRYDPVLSYGISSAFILLGTTVTQCLVCLPKIMAYGAGETVTRGSNSIRPTQSTEPDWCCESQPTAGPSGKSKQKMCTDKETQTEW